MINLNSDIVQEYKKKHNITKAYDGDLLSLVHVQFLEQMQAEEEPPLFEYRFRDYDEVDDEVVPDDYERREEALSDDKDEGGDVDFGRGWLTWFPEPWPVRALPLC